MSGERAAARERGRELNPGATRSRRAAEAAPRTRGLGRRGVTHAVFSFLCLSVLLAPPLGGRSGRGGGTGALAAEQRKDYYKILGVLPTAKPKELKKAYHKLSLKYHPDKNKDPGAEDMFMDIAEAYEVLSDDERRRNYDNSGSDDNKSGGNSGEPKKEETSHEPLDLHLRFSGGDFKFKFMPPEEEKPDKAPDMVVTLDVELLDLYTGAEFNVSFTRQEVCSHCRGSGAAHKHDVRLCPLCHGTGRRCSIQRTDGEPLGYFWQQFNTTCSKCDGSGHVVNVTCPVCGGNRVLLKPVTRPVHVPAGAPDSYRITLANEGDQVPDLLPGAVHIGLRVADHATFTRKDNDLSMRANITLFEALLGFVMNVSHLDNRTVEVKHEAVSKPGFSKLMPGLGMPIPGGGGTYGDLTILFDIDFPKKLDEEEKDLLSSVLDEEEIAKIEAIITKRAVSENLDAMNKPLGHSLQPRPGVESFAFANIIDLSMEMKNAAMLIEWSLFVAQPGWISLQVWRPAPRTEP